MRERLVAAFVSVTLVTVVVFGVVRAYALDHLIEEQQQARVDRSAQLVAAAVEAHGTPDATYLRSLLDADESIRYVSADGRVVVARGAGYNGGGGGPLARSAEVSGGGTVTVTRSREAVDRVVRDALLPVVLLGIALMAVAALVGYAVARWLSRPFRELAGAARDVGRGRLAVELPHYAIPEADLIARALERSAAQVRETLTHERTFWLDASHELRTPITALRLELEDLAWSGDLSAASAAQLRRSVGELDRLSGAVDTMLAASRERRPDDLDVTERARAAAARWIPHLQRLGRDLVVVAPGPAPVRLAPGALDQVLDGLVENALTRGGGVVTLEVEDLGDHVRLQVRDESSAGTRPPASLGPFVDAATAFGGHLFLERGAARTAYTLLLPRA